MPEPMHLFSDSSVSQISLRCEDEQNAFDIGDIGFGGTLPAQESPTTPKAVRVRIIEGPKIELAKERLTIITWTTTNPGGSPVHYGIVRYGTDPSSLRETAKSPIRLNPDHSSTVFRVRLDDLKSRPTYYH